MTAPKHLPRHWYMQRRIKMQHLKVLVAIRQHETLHRAADMLGLSQPAVSKLLAELEGAVGHGLFERSGRMLKVNAFGAVLTRYADTMLHELELAADEFNALLDGRNGRVVLGAIDGPTVRFLPSLLARMQQEYPDIDIDIEIGSSERLLAMLGRGELDVYFGRPSEGLDLARFTYSERWFEKLSVIARPDHPLTGQGLIDINVLRVQKWIVQQRGSTLRQCFDGVFARAGLTGPAHVVNAQSLLMTLAYLERSDALSLVSEAVAAQQQLFGQIAIIPTEIDLSVRPYGVIYSSQRTPTPALKTFLAMLDTHDAGS